jgi:arginine-tRNA-protein transferase
MTAQFRFPRFFVTSPAPCPYLPGKMERKVFTDLGGQHPAQLNDALGRIGFRRSQGVAYRPSCMDCTACISVRVIAADFKPNASQRKLIRRNSDLEITPCQPWATAEQFNLLRHYLNSRHPDGGMAGMDEMDYADMVEQSPVDTWVVEYREPSVHGERGKLVGVCLTDRQNDGVSLIYSFFDTENERRLGLGTFIIMDHIQRTAEAGLDYVYLGYWVDGCRRMEYKTRFQPVERLGPDGWHLMTPAEDGDVPAMTGMPELRLPVAVPA